MALAYRLDGDGEPMSNITQLHAAVKHGDLTGMTTLLSSDRGLANARSETDARGTYPLHVAAEFGQKDAALLLLDYGADVSLLDTENDATALCWAAFFGRPGVVAVLLEAGSDPSPRNKHGLTPLGCAVGGTQGRWKQFSNASLEDWQQAADAIRTSGGVE
jgi:thiamine pyrophosphate-dependent acetolactate synthase large subunit-like protein